jgi:hypothetical protein
MLTDLAALTPPLVMAVAFIAGVVFLLRREMAPRRRGIDQPEDPDSRSGPHGEIQAPVFTEVPGGQLKGHGEPAPDNNSVHNHAARSGMADLPGREDDDGDIGRAEGGPAAPPKA